MKSTRVYRWVFAAAAVLAVLAALYGVWQLSRSRDFQLFGKIVPRIETAERVVALTFDDGPTAQYAPGVLAPLKRKKVKATFFLIGSDMEKNPDLASAIVADGHEVGNHTWSHPDMTLADTDRAREEIEPTDAAIRKAGFTGEILFRPPFGKKLIGLPLYLSEHGRTTVTWDVEPESFKDVAADPARITQHVLDKARPGSIIILHVMYRARETSRQALPDIIDGLRERGFSFVTVGELIAMDRKPR